jgi:hypothetical protein
MERSEKTGLKSFAEFPPEAEREGVPARQGILLRGAFPHPGMLSIPAARGQDNTPAGAFMTAVAPGIVA